MAEDLTKVSRTEKILHNMINPGSVDIEPPQSRIEKLLIKIYQNGGSGTGGGVNTTYELTLKDNVLSLVPSDGTPTQSVTLPTGGGEADGNTTYILGFEDGKITLKDSDGKVQSVAIPVTTDTNTTYKISIAGNTLTLTPSTGAAQSVDIPVSPDTNTTYEFAFDETSRDLTITPSEGEATVLNIPGGDGSVSVTELTEDEVTTIVNS